MRFSKESLGSLQAGADKSGKVGDKGKARSSNVPAGRVKSSFEIEQGTSSLGSRKSSTGKGIGGSHK